MRAHVPYEKLVARKLRENRRDRDLAYARAVGCTSVEMFNAQGDGHVAVLRHYGLSDGMAVYDLGCGCGRTAQALQRSGWIGKYVGADVVRKLVDELNRKCPGYLALVNRTSTIVAEDESMDMVFNWSVFTHLQPEESYLYMADSFRAMKPGGKLVFSFLEFEDANHHQIFHRRLKTYAESRRPTIQDSFLHRDWLRTWARQIGFAEPVFTAGSDDTNFPPFWQSLAAMEKPA